MSINAAVVKELMAAGVTGDALVTALERIEAYGRGTPSAGALRTRRWRDRKASVTEASQTVTGDDKKEIPQTPLEKTTSNSEPSDARELDETPRDKRGTRLPPDFKPLPNVIQDAVNRGLTEPEITDQLERFRDWADAATGQVAIKRDWNAAARNWLRRSADEKKRRNGNHRSKSTHGSALRDALAEQRADLAARFGEPSEVDQGA